jgi:D-alanyl-D-alanine carboxypeptidase
MDPYAALPSGATPRKRISLVSVVLLFFIFLSFVFFIGSLSYYLFIQRFDYLPQLTEVSQFENTVTQLPEVEENQLGLNEQLGLLELPRNLGIQQGNLDRSSRTQNQFAINPAVDPSIYRTFSGSGFQEYYEAIEYTKVTPANGKPEIRGVTAVDQVIQEIAEGRGYQLRVIADEDQLTPVDGELLQTEAGDAWETMRNAAAVDGVTLRLVSGYRSVNDQRDIFLNQIINFTNEQITAREVDSQIDTILVTRSIPGYSRHHTGYTIDISCGSTGLTVFVETRCYQWISGNNYLNAKRFGFIPGYPQGADNQGPNPEAWEYVWVGEPGLRRPSADE